MEIRRNDLLLCKVLDQLEGSPLPLYLPPQTLAQQSVRTLFLEVDAEPPADMSGHFTLVEDSKVLPIKIVDWNRLGSRIWIKCFAVNVPISTVSPPPARPRI